MDYAPRPKHLRKNSGGAPARKAPRGQAQNREWPPALRGFADRVGTVWNFLRAYPRLSTAGGLLLAIVLIAAAGDYWWKEMRWRYILIHHTASDIGNLDYYKKFHVEQRGWSDIAYHFIVNNGSMNTTIGQIEESDLWKSRKANLSTRNWYANYFGIAVVLVGNFERHKPAPLQQEALITLLTNLATRYDIPPERIVGHREVQNTACPGKHLNMNEIRAAVKKNL
ncbi:MAG: N-acetylmuramoyl-L-alanine amidase [bacterium]|nr:N-acetylmuramoyl-L-alanine amidase [bacterium]